MGPEHLVLNVSSMMGLKHIMDELMFEPRDNLTLAVIASILRKIAPGSWIVIGWLKDSDSNDDRILLRFETLEDRVEWQITNSIVS